MKITIDTKEGHSEEWDKAMRMMTAEKAYCAVNEFKEYLRQKCKYADLPAKQGKLIDDK